MGSTALVRHGVTRRWAALALAAASVVTMSACSGGGSNAQWVSVAAADREPAPVVEGAVFDAGGTTSTMYDLADHRGEVVVINVWGSWCSPCRAEADTLEALSQELAPQGVTFLGINTKDDAASARAFLASHKTSYPSIVDENGEIQVAFRDSLPAVSIPTTWIIDRDGRVAARVLGPVTVEGLRDHVDAVLDESTTSTSAP